MEYSGIYRRRSPQRPPTRPVPAGAISGGRSIRGLAVAAICVALVATMATPSQADPFTAGGLEGYSPASSRGCASPRTPAPGTVALANILTSAYGIGADVQVRECDTAEYLSDHSRGLAVDWSVPAGSVAGQQVLDWLFAGDGRGNNHVRLRRLGISYIIWNNRIWTTKDDKARTSPTIATWRPYDRSSCDAKYGSSADCGHERHMHLSLSDAGGAKSTSWWQPVMDGHRDSPNGAGPVLGPGGGDTVGVRRAGVWSLNDQNDGSAPERSFLFGEPGDVPLVGDWNGDGIDTVGVWRSGYWYLNDQNDNSVSEHVIVYGNADDVPVVGDWNGDGIDTIGVRRQGYWYLNDQNDGSAPERSFLYGEPGDVPVVGDWNGDGIDTIGVRRAGYWYLNDQNDGSAPDRSFLYGEPGDTPVVGDWNRDGVDTVGVWRSGYWYLNNQNDSSAPEYTIVYGNADDRPVVGNWDGV